MVPELSSSVMTAPACPIAHPERFYIGGEWVEPSTSSRIEVIQPATEEVFSLAAEAMAADVGGAVGAARAAFDDGPWPRMTHADRANVLLALAAGVRSRAADIATVWTSEVGILHSAALASVESIAVAYERYAAMAEDFRFVERHPSSRPGKVGFLVREPVGIVALIIPWNGPMATIAHKLAPALLAGCTAVVKCSPEAPGAGHLLAEILDDIGIPDGVVNCLTADRRVSELLVADPRVDKVSLTGSTAAGRRVAAVCSERIARVTLELGGKSAALILDDYDLGTAAETLAASTRLLTGQVCAALTRVFVRRDRHDELVAKLADQFSRTKVGDPFDPTVEMGPLVTDRHRAKVEALISRGVEEGATLVTGGGRPAGLARGYFIEPTVLAEVDNRSTIAREEVFGPVLSVIPVDDERHAIRLANETIYGLNASVFTNEADRAFEVARELRSGTVGHNAYCSDFSIAFGGFKQSGIGREGGREGLLPYLESKTIVLEAAPT